MKTRGMLVAVVALTAFSLSACVTYPNTGPSSPAYIGDGKTQANFAQADAYCRDLAQQQTGPTPGEAATQSAAGSAILGTLLGAGLGAGIGAAAGNPALGAAIGAATGLAGGAAYGSAAGASSAWTVQQRYDTEYHRCMYAAGHKVPAGWAPSTPPMASAIPPTPPGYGSMSPPLGAQASPAPTGDPTRGQLLNVTRWKVQLYIDQDPNSLPGAPDITLDPNEVRPQNLDIGRHRIIAQATVETQFGPRPVGRFDRTIQVDPRGAGWSLRLNDGDFR